MHQSESDILSEKPAYTIKTAEIPVADYIRGYRDADRFAGYCRECPNYGNSWACPPFLNDSCERIGRWQNALLVACTIPLPDRQLSGTETLAILQKPRLEMEQRLLDLEKAVGGLAFGFSGNCPRCEVCSRKSGRKCRHPELVRPALEAYGFDVCKTMEEIFGESLQWASGERRPNRLTLVGALFHDCAPDTVSYPDPESQK